eukprot:PhM_4_TR11685/c1_g2_i2/m.76232
MQRLVFFGISSDTIKQNKEMYTIYGAAMHRPGVGESRNCNCRTHRSKRKHRRLVRTFPKRGRRLLRFEKQARDKHNTDPYVRVLKISRKRYTNEWLYRGLDIAHPRNKPVAESKCVDRSEQRSAELEDEHIRSVGQEGVHTIRASPAPPTGLNPSVSQTEVKEGQVKRHWRYTGERVGRRRRFFEQKVQRGYRHQQLERYESHRLMNPYRSVTRYAEYAARQREKGQTRPPPSAWVGPTHPRQLWEQTHRSPTSVDEEREGGKRGCERSQVPEEAGQNFSYAEYLRALHEFVKGLTDLDDTDTPLPRMKPRLPTRIEPNSGEPVFVCRSENVGIGFKGLGKLMRPPTERVNRNTGTLAPILNSVVDVVELKRMDTEEQLCGVLDVILEPEVFQSHLSPTFRPQSRMSRFMIQHAKSLETYGVMRAHEHDFGTNYMPLFTVKKKDESLRLILDARHINEAFSKPPEMKLPRIHDFIQYVLQNEFCAQCDARSWFYQIPIHPEISAFFGAKLCAGRGEV